MVIKNKHARFGAKDNTRVNYPTLDNLRASKSADTLTELLALSEFEGHLGWLGSEAVSKAITLWAEEAVVAGNTSTSLLMLASLGLDSHPNAQEVRDYLGRFIRESGFRYPSSEYCALIWLKFTLAKVIACDNRRAAEYQLGLVTQQKIDSPCAFFIAVLRFIAWQYDALFESYGDDSPAPAAAMTEQQLLSTLQTPLIQISNKINNADWLAFLVKK